MLTVKNSEKNHKITLGYTYSYKKIKKVGKRSKKKVMDLEQRRVISSTYNGSKWGKHELITKKIL
jgi:hypothetical protein